MPIIFVHGVNVRSRASFEQTTVPFLRRYIAPVISRHHPESVSISQAYWGDLGARFYFDGTSRPASQLLSQGLVDAGTRDQFFLAGEFPGLAQESATGASSSTPDGLISGSDSEPSEAVPAVSEMRRDDLADLLIAALIQDVGQERAVTELLAAIEGVLDDPDLMASLGEGAPDEQIAQLIEAVASRMTASSETPALIPQGVGLGDRFSRAYDWLNETVRRTSGVPVWAASVVLAELRKPVHELLSVFMGDVFEYLAHRIDSHRISDAVPQPPGPLPQCFLNKLLEARDNQQRRDGEPLVVLSHSMGGQIVYDALTAFMPADPRFKDVHVDFWCATASQVGFFEETKQLLASREEHRTGHPVPFPGAHLGSWWNVHDPNDVLSFSVRGIIQGVDDEAWSSGMSLASAHGGYLMRPSFYRRFANKLAAALTRSRKTSP